MCNVINNFEFARDVAENLNPKRGWQLMVTDTKSCDDPILKRPRCLPTSSVNVLGYVETDGVAAPDDREPVPLTAENSESSGMAAPASSEPVQGSQDEDDTEEEINLDYFELSGDLGKGAFGKVVHCTVKGIDRSYAMKVQPKRDVRVDSVMLEYRVMRQAEHPFVVSLMCAFQTERHLCFVMEYLGGGNLLQLLEEEESFTEAQMRFYTAELLLAIDHLHAKGIMHRDLKLENVMTDCQGHVRLVDFGLCKEQKIGKTSRSSSICGTPGYIAPEVILHSDFGMPVDWWSFGVIAYEMLHGQLPFIESEEYYEYASENSAQNASQIANKDKYDAVLNNTLSIAKNVSVEAHDLISGLLQKDPMHRIGGGGQDSGELTSHAFYKNIDWEALYRKEIEPPFTPRLAELQNAETEAFNLPPENDAEKRRNAELFKWFYYKNPNWNVDD